jgi:hypothetical protein
MIKLLLTSLYLLKPTGYTMHHVLHSKTVRSADTVFMCFVFTREQTAPCATYTMNWLFFITEMKSVYSAVRTGSLNKAVCASSSKGCICLGNVWCACDIHPYVWPNSDMCESWYTNRWAKPHPHSQVYITAVWYPVAYSSTVPRACRPEKRRFSDAGPAGLII